MHRAWFGVLMVGALLSACGEGAGATGDEPQPSAVIEGAYVGELSVETDVPADAIFASCEIEVDGDGSVTGVVTSKAPSATVGEEGTVTGRLTPEDAISYETELTIAFPSLGTVRAAGVLVFAEPTRSLAGQLSARDEGGHLLGNAAFVAHQE